MKKRILIIALLSMIALSLKAQETELISRHKFGLTASSTTLAEESYLATYSAFSVGGVYHILPAFALKPSIVFLTTTDSEENKFAGTDAFDSKKVTLLGFLLEGHYYHLLSPGLYLYGGPGVGYSVWNQTNYSIDGKNGEDNSTYLQIDASLGLQYNFNRSVALFIQSGLRFLMETRKLTGYDAITGTVTAEQEYVHQNIYAKNPSLGVTVYFN